MKQSHLTRILLVFCLLTVFGSCRQETLPPGVIDTATMTDFLTEAHLIEGYADARRVEDPDSTDIIVHAAYDSLYNKYNITPADYDSSLRYYLLHPQLMEDIYRRVSENINKINEELP
jgi:hypothetical protein